MRLDAVGDSTPGDVADTTWGFTVVAVSYLLPACRCENFGAELVKRNRGEVRSAQLGVGDQQE